jgi:predicted dehydrogenase
VIGVGVIGYGYWGPNIARHCAGLGGCRLVAVADSNRERLAAAARSHPAARVVTSAEELLDCDDIDAVAVATPTSTHYALARAALLRGKHVLVEKPMAATVAQSRDLISLAEQRARVLMVDHTFLYTGAVRKIRELVQDGELGEIYYYDAVRVNLGIFRDDVNVLWDLAPHDFSIMAYLIDKEPVAVSAVGSAPVARAGWRRDSIAYATLEYADGTLGHIHMNWLSPVKIRRVVIGGSRKTIVYDHRDSECSVLMFDRGADAAAADRLPPLCNRVGGAKSLDIDRTEALELACREFVASIRMRRRPLTDGWAGLKVVRWLEAAQKSLEARHPVALDMPAAGNGPRRRVHPLHEARPHGGASRV